MKYTVDKFNRKLIIELKAGPIKDEHIGQILSYEGDNTRILNFSPINSWIFTEFN